MQEFDITLVGGSLIGQSAALAFALKGFSVCLIEPAPIVAPREINSKTPYDLRVLAISSASQSFFQQLNIWQDIISSRAGRYETMQVWDGKLDGKIKFNSDEFLLDNLGYIVEHQVVYAALQRAIQQLKNLKTFYQEKVHDITVSDDRVVIKTQNRQLASKLIVAADGKNSFVRTKLNLPIKKWDYNQTALVATLAGEKSHNKTAFQKFDEFGPLALLPLSDLNHTSIVWTRDKTQANNLTQISDIDFANKVGENIDFVMGKMQLVSERRIFPLTAQHARSYVSHRVALVGDSAHTIHPLAGQGANLGFLDIMELTNVVSRSKQKHRDFGRLSELKRYERKRKYHNEVMLLAMEAFKRGFSSTNTLLEILRNNALNWVNDNQLAKRFFVNYAMGNNYSN